MKLTLTRYSFLLFLQFLFLTSDLLLNSFSYLVRGDKLSILFVFLIQDVLLILSLALFIVGIYSNYVYKTGVAELLYKKLRTPLNVLALYFILSISHHIWIVVNHHKPYAQWPVELTALLIIHRLVSPVYYYLYKRSSLRMSDPRFYEDMSNCQSNKS